MNDSTPSDRPAQPLDFEAALKRLEEIVRLIEEGNLGLNESLERYEEGVGLLRQSYDILQKAERRIELLSGIDSQGNPITEPFDHSATFEAGDPGKQRSRRRSSPKKRADDQDADPAGDTDLEENS